MYTAAPLLRATAQKVNGTPDEAACQPVALLIIQTKLSVVLQPGNGTHWNNSIGLHLLGDEFVYTPEMASQPQGHRQRALTVSQMAQKPISGRNDAQIEFFNRTGGPPGRLRPGLLSGYAPCSRRDHPQYVPIPAEPRPTR